MKVLFLAIFPVALLSIGGEYIEYKYEKQAIRNDLIDLRKASLKDHVEQVLSEIEQADSELSMKVEQQNQEKVNLLHTLFSNLYHANKAYLKTQEIERLLIQSLHHEKASDKLSSFFVYKRDGSWVAGEFCKGANQQNLATLKDNLGTEPFTLIRNSIRETGEGGLASYWGKMALGDSLPQKYLSYCKIFEETGWIIGRTVSIENMMIRKQSEVLAKVASLRFKEMGYMFVNTLDGKALVSENEVLSISSEKKSIAREDISFFQQQRMLLQNEGSGFILLSPENSALTKGKAIVYVESHLNWNWIVGGVSYIHDIESIMDRKKSNAYWLFFFRMMLGLLFFMFLLGLVFYFSNALGLRVETNIAQLHGFLMQHQENNTSIDLQTIRYDEFKELARVANEVIVEMNNAFNENQKEKIYFARLFHNAPEGIVVTGKSLVIKRVNKEFQNLFGYKEGDVVGKPSSSLTPYRFLEEEEQIYKETVEGRSVSILATQRMKNDGTLVDVSIFATPVFHGERYFATYLIFRNISERVAAENKLAESQNQMQSFFDHASEGFCIFQFDKPFDWSKITDKRSFIAKQVNHLRLVRVNMMIDHFWSVRKNARLYESIASLFPQRTALIRKLLRELLDKKSLDMILYSKVDDKLVWIRGQFVCFLDSEGQIKGVFGILNDITERRNYEKKLKRAKLRAEQADRLKTAFLSNMSHEIRTPMNAITGFADLLNEDDLREEERKEFISEINANSKVLLKLIEDIIDIAKIEANQLDINWEWVDLETLLNQAKRNAERELNGAIGKHVLLKVQKEGAADIKFKTDYLRLMQVLANLLSNAIKFTDEGHINFGFELKEDNKNICFFVEDTGVGILPENHKVIFDRFVRIDHPSKGLLGGTGLGLSIAKYMIGRLGGDLTFTSVPNVGSRFEFTLSIEGLDYKENVLILPENHRIGNVDQDWSTSTILVAEDNAINYKLIEKILKKTNVKLLRAENGAEAVDMVRNNPEISLVLMDLQMPVMDGRQATTEIRAYKNKLPIIVQTAYTLDHDIEQLKQVGCSAVVNKPIKADELISEIQFALYGL